MASSPPHRVNSPTGYYDSGYVEGDLEPWRPNGNQNEDELEGNSELGGDEENHGFFADGDNSSEVGPEILNDISDGESEDERSRPRRRPRKSKSRSTPCKECDDIKLRWHSEVENLTRQSEATERQLNARIRELLAEIERLEARGRIEWDPWSERLQDLLRGFSRFDIGEGHVAYPGYNDIYRDSCRQGNMSVSLKFTHPNLSVRQDHYTPEEIGRHFRKQALGDRYNGLENLKGIHRSLRDIIFPLRCTRLNPRRLLENAPFPFENLPVSIQCRIWKELIPSGEIIHCLSRLDPQNPPLDQLPGEIRFPRRFHIGNTSSCCIAVADKPARYLGYLLVSKRWYYATTHLFYATNTFAFSSLGEFGRFCNGIGKARVQRLVNVELMWTGALTPRQERGVSLRKQPLAWFMHTSRLRSLVVHINESSKLCMRRPYEMMDPKDYYKDFAADDIDEDELDIFGMEARRTDLQPNFRKNRSMRTVQGMDFIYQLRGMRRVRFCDSNAEGPDTEIRDWSFTRDINSMVRMKKTDAATFKAEIENLDPLTSLKDVFVPDDEIKELVLSFYDDNLVEDISTYGSETSSSSSSSSGISRVHTLSDSSGSDSDHDSGGSSSSRGDSPDPHMDEDMDVDDGGTDADDGDGDIDMDDDGDAPDGPGDNDPQPQNINRDSTVSDSGPSSRSRSRTNDGKLDDTGETSVPPETIIIEDDDVDDNIRHRSRHSGGDRSSDSGLFVSSGSGTAQEDTSFIDLTGDDDEHEADDGEEVEEVENPDNNDDEEESIKSEESPSRSPSGPFNSDGESDAGGSRKRSGGEGTAD
ncbi:hypothetical protein GGR51DRAFT_527678 [Nemania sp. FL0031]|nr:hypothetical protein GGR51DRAFT_527678 [Nemania sp. FL0031]